MLATTVHSGSAHVRGTARNYSYFVCSLFEAVTCANGRQVWRNTGVHTPPRRSRKKAVGEGQRLAEERGAEWIYGYGSLHNTEVRPTERYSHQYP